jgi:methyl-accepting chemotaxis protein
MTIGRKIGGFGLTAVILVVIGLISFWSTSRLITANGWAAHSQEVLTTLDSLVSAIKDVETSQRGYIITGSEAALGPYTAAVPELEKASRSLRSLTSDNPEQQRRLDALEPLIATRLEELRRAVDARNAGGINAGAEVVKENLAKRTMHEIRRIASEMKAVELKLIAQRNRDVVAAGQLATYGISAVVLLALVCGPLIALLIVRPITTAFRVLIDGVEKFGQGRLDYRAGIRSRDEFGALAAAFNRMAEQRQQSSDGISEAISRLTSTSSEILATTSQQTASAAQQAAAVAQTVATVEQVTHTATQSSERARGGRRDGPAGAGSRPDRTDEGPRLDRGAGRPEGADRVDRFEGCVTRTGASRGKARQSVRFTHSTATAGEGGHPWARPAPAR